LRKSLIENKIDALLVTSTANIYYLTGLNDFSFEEREAFLFMSRSDLNMKAYLFTNPLYFGGIKSKLPKNVTPILHTELFKKIKESNIKRVGFERNLTYAEYKRFKKETGLKFILAEPIVEELRTIKDDGEIKNIKLACNLTDKCYSYILKNIRTNITEKELAWRIEKFIKENGGELAFESIIAFGPNSATPHHKTSNKKLTNKDQFILLDFGAKVDGYCSDMTRTLLTKQNSDRAKKIYQTVLEAQQKAIEAVNSEKLIVNSSEIAKNVDNYLVSKGFKPVPHGLGHGIGLEVHELPHLSPKSHEQLQKGMIFTIEPGIYIPGFGGVRIEDDFVFDKNLEQLTRSPK